MPRARKGAARTQARRRLLRAARGYRGTRRKHKSQAKVARAQIVSLEQALDQFRLDVGRYPSTEEGLAALNEAPASLEGWAGPYLRKAVPMDPWGRPYVYEQPGQNTEIDLASLGRDGRPGGSGEDADIVNW